MPPSLTARDMLGRTEAFLKAHPELWDDGGVAFCHGPNRPGHTGPQAVVAFLATRPALPSLSGQATHQVAITAQALHEIDAAAGRKALAKLIAADLRTFSIRRVDPVVIEELADVFFDEMPAARVYGNLRVVTRHSSDRLVCAVTGDCVACWLYSDDE